MADPKQAGGRRPGDKNHTFREQRLQAQLDELKAKLAAEKAKVKVRDAEKRELRQALAMAKPKRGDGNKNGV